MLKEMLARWGRKTPAVYAVLCTAQADGSNAKYRAGERHTMMVMVNTTESTVETSMAELLHMQGWSEIAVLEQQLLEVPFFSKDRAVSACYVSAVTSDGGLIVYDEPVEGLGAASNAHVQ